MAGDGQPIFSFGSWVKQRRRALRLTQEELARRVGCAAVTLRKIEADERRPSAQIASLIADQLGLTATEREAFLRAARGELAPDRLTGAMSAGAAEDRAPESPLPVPPTPLVGRDAEIAALCEYLRDPDVRMLTLTGPPGIGKTRLALATAASLARHFPGGVRFVPLAPVAEAGLVLPTIAGALGIKEHDGSSLSLMDRVVGRLQAQQLLVLDNFEHLLDASPLLSSLLAAAPGPKLLVTSRAALRISAEHEYAVPPLALPDLGRLAPPEALVQYPSVRLFVQRARAVDSSFRLDDGNAPAVAAICVRLDGLPLAIELAAARSKLFAPQALLARLDNRLAVLTEGARDLPARQRTLRAAIEWSYQLLSPAEQRLFNRLGVFAGGWSVLAAEAVAGDGSVEASWPELSLRPGVQPSDTVLRSLSSLLDHSLIRQIPGAGAEPRFTMLEMLREYALERLDVAGERRLVQQLHAAHYAALAEQSGRLLIGPDSEAGLARLDQEHDNLRAALAWAVKAGGRVGDGTGEPEGATEQRTALAPPATELAVRLAAALAWFWIDRGYFDEARRYLDQILRLTAAHPRGALHARSLGVAAELAGHHGDLTSARSLSEESLAIWQELGDPAGIAAAQGSLWWTLVQQGERQRALSLAQQSLATWRELGNEGEIVWALDRLAWQMRHDGDLDAACAMLEDALAIVIRHGDDLRAADLLQELSMLDFLQGRLELSRARHEQSLAIVRRTRDERQLPELLHTMAWNAYKQGDFDRAAALFAEELAIVRRLGRAHDAAWANNHLGDVLRCQGDYERAGERYKESLAMFREQGHRQGVAAILHNLGYVARWRGDLDEAEAYFREALKIFHDVGYAWSIGDAMAGLAATAAERGLAERAARLVGAAEGIQTRIDSRGLLLDAANRLERERTEAAIAAHLGEARRAAAVAEGRALSLSEAVAYAEER